MSEVKWVVVERQNMSGRYVALPGVSYPTQAEAEAHIRSSLARGVGMRFVHTTSKSMSRPAISGAA